VALWKTSLFTNNTAAEADAATEAQRREVVAAEEKVRPATHRPPGYFARIAFHSDCIATQKLLSLLYVAIIRAVRFVSRSDFFISGSMRLGWERSTKHDKMMVGSIRTPL